MVYPKTILLMLVMGSSGLTAQQMLHYYLGPGGGRLSGEKLQLDWALGEAAVSTLRSDGGYLTEGFIQPDMRETDFMEGLPPFPENAILISPNPGRGHFLLEFNFEADQAGLQCRDPAGRTIFRRSLLAEGPSSLRLDAAHWPAGVYLLTVWSRAPDRLQTIQLVKTN